MGRKARDEWVALSPPFPENSAAKHAFRAHAMKLSKLLDQDDGGQNFNEAIEESQRVHSSSERSTALRAALSVLTDLARQRWSIRINKSGDLEVKRPEEDHLDPMRVKARIRRRNSSSATSNFENRRQGGLLRRWRRRPSTTGAWYRFTRFSGRTGTRRVASRHARANR